MIKYSVDSSDKFRSVKKGEDKLFNYKQSSLANRTLNLSKSQTSEPRPDPHLLLSWELGEGVLIQVPTERIRKSWTKCFALTNEVSVLDKSQIVKLFHCSGLGVGGA